jgi:hypothetical protein
LPIRHDFTIWALAGELADGGGIIAEPKALEVSVRAEPEPGGPAALTSAQRAGRTAVRALAIGAGVVLVAAGLVLAVLPGHLGIPLVAVGLILVLRHSPQARRRFIRLQRRHPRVVFPMRRLMRREPEVAPVLWQQFLRFERLILPLAWRRARRWRRRLFRGR